MRFLSFVMLSLRKYVEIISLKAPGNYSASFRSNKTLVLLCEGPKPNISMISGFLDPWDLWILLHQNTILQNILGNIWTHF